jgi:formate dehydrogenase subunit delta
MDIENLVKMANRIGSFFEGMPEQEEAMKEVAMHLKKFWEPRMRSALLAHIDEHGADKLKPIVAQAISTHRNLLA